MAQPAPDGQEGWRRGGYMARDRLISAITCSWPVLRYWMVNAALFAVPSHT
jgi:hypothetical protein